VEPSHSGFTLEEVTFPTNYFIGNEKYTVDETYLSVAVQQGTKLVAPTGGDLRVEYNFAHIGSNTEELFLTEICWRSEFLSLCLRTLDGTPLEEGMLRIFGDDRRVSAGDVLAEVASETLVLSIWDYHEDSLPNGEKILISEITIDDLLRDSLGRGVYISDPSQRIWEPEEAFAHVSQNCENVGISGSSPSQVVGYAEEIALRAGFPLDMRNQLGAIIDPNSGCAIVAFDPRGEPGLFLYENGEGWVQILRTVPLR